MRELTWSQLLAQTSERLHARHHEARAIVEAASGLSAVELLTTRRPATPDMVEAVQAHVERRLRGEPLQYVVGTWDFRHLQLLVDGRVLIPRPETEQVVGAALDAILSVESPRVLDLGTGSGAIALSMATERDDAEVLATDASSNALDTAKENASRQPPDVRARVRFAQGSWWQALGPEDRNSFDLIVTNPPYIRADEQDTLPAEVVEWEPHGALFAGDDGLDDIRIIVDGALEWLALTPATLVIELAPQQAVVACDLAMSAGFSSVTTGVDFAGRDRWIVARR